MDEPPNRNHHKAYICWSDMFKRCYNENWLQKHQTYKHSEVCDEWCVFDNFLLWYQENYVQGWHLDKDILGGSNLYSPKTCCFLPPYVNKFLTKRESGVIYYRGKYVMQMSDRRNCRHIRKEFDSFDDAKYFYYINKRQKGIELIEEYSLRDDLAKAILEFVENNFK